MLPSGSPFPCSWWGTDWPSLGSGGPRPVLPVYGPPGAAELPPLPFALLGDLAWLRALPEQAGHRIGDAAADEVAAALPRLRRAASRRKVRLPETFTRFLADPELHGRLRSLTDCTLDLPGKPARLGVGRGWLVRFLVDSQGGQAWFLYLTPDGSDHAVVSSARIDLDAEEDELPAAEAADFTFEAESFEAFLCRFWLGNEVGFAELDGTAPPAVAPEFLDFYRDRN